MNWIELLGTLASVVVAISLTLKNMKGLRIVNTLGALAFSLYGILINAWPVFGLNAFIVAINMYYLWVLSGDSAHFQAIEVDKSSILLENFLDFYSADIKKFQPDFERKFLDSTIKGAFFLRQAIPMGLFLCRPLDQGRWEILLDYTIPSNRDLKNGRFFYSEGYRALFPEGVREFIALGKIPRHVRYLQKLGFKQSKASLESPTYSLIIDQKK